MIHSNVPTSNDFCDVQCITTRRTRDPERGRSDKSERQYPLGRHTGSSELVATGDVKHSLFRAASFLHRRKAHRSVSCYYKCALCIHLL